MIVLAVIEAMVLIATALATVNMLGNVRAYHRLGMYASRAHAGSTPFVSVLVPARDEAVNIGACVQSLLAQEYPRFEVRVLDDGSSDDTAAIVAALAERDTRLVLHHGEPVPAGWMGKPFACHQLARYAGGDLLIFTDADTRHGPEMIRAVVGAVTAGADVVTAFPEQEIGGWAEALVVPLVLFIIWAFLPVGRVWADPRPSFVAANGQLLAFTRAAYGTVGGHAAVRDTVLEDMGLGQRAKQFGLRLRLTDGTGTTRTRMYRSPGEVWRGFSKNAYTLLGNAPPLALAFTLLLVALYLFPVAILALGIVRGHDGLLWREGPLVLIGFMLGQRGILAWRARLPYWQALLHPLSVLAFVLILANSVRWQRRGFGMWKGRVFATTPGLPPDAPADTSATPR